MRTELGVAVCLSLATLPNCSSKAAPPDVGQGPAGSAGSQSMTTSAGSGGSGDSAAGAFVAAGGSGPAAGAGGVKNGGGAASSTVIGGATGGNADGGRANGGGGATGGSSNTAGGGAAGGGDPFLADVTPSKNGDLWRLSFGDVVLEVNALKGASVTTFSLGGHNVLADGSHFRPSPQKTWNWPPPAEIAEAPYTATMNGNLIVMDSQTNAMWGLKAKKRFWANSAHQVATIEYTLTNTSSARASWGPWEVSRLNATGLTFFPEGNAIAAKPSAFGQLLALQSAGGVSWLDYKSANYSAGNYIVAHDGLEGWSAHTEAGVVFIKSVPDILPAQIPPEEGEVQLWTDNTHTALEMENEGAYVALDAGQSIVWTMRWYLRAIPSDAAASVGNAKLLDFVRGQLLK
jgi:Domain of unknown function (DUF4380)